MLPACGGGSSSSSGGGGGNNDAGYARGVADTLGLILEDLTALQATLAGDAAPVQTSRGTLGRSFALLEPRQSEDLAARLRTLIERFQVAQSEAAAPGAGRTEALAAQTAADQALAALRLVVAADTAARAGGGEAARTAAVEALTKIADLEPTDENPQQAIDDALRIALDEAKVEVARLQAALTLAQAAGSADVVVLQAALVRAETARDSAAAERDRALAAADWMARGVKPGFGRVTTSTESRTGEPAKVVFHRRTAKALVPTTTSGTPPATVTVSNHLSFTSNFDPHGTDAQQGSYSFTGGTHGVGGTGSTQWEGYASSAYDPDPTTNDDAINLAPDAILYASGQSRQQVIAADPNTGHFRARGFVYRGGWNNPIRYASTNAANFVYRMGVGSTSTSLSAGATILDPQRVSITTPINPLIDAKVRHQTLLIQGRSPHLGANAGKFFGTAHTPLTTFRYDADKGLTMGFGGDGVIFADLERYQAKSCEAGQLSCNNATTVDIEISFGEPDFDPAGQGMFYWSADVVSPRWGTTERLRDPDDTESEMTWEAASPAGRDHGQYNLLLSNDAGAGQRMLSYAAYGLFNFRDRLYGNPPEFYGRVQTFHYGVEAFRANSMGSTGREVKDMDQITATFKGRTHGWVVTRNPRSSGNYDTLTRMRGDVTLAANIGGGSADGTTHTISGTIKNLMQSPVADREAPVASNVPWVAGRLPNTVKLQGAYANDVIGVAPILTSGDTTTPLSDFAALGVAHGDLATTAAVKADGTFKGTVTAETASENPDTRWERGEYEGALYGPTTALEAAGTWWLQANRNGDDGTPHPERAIIGSFGAVCTEDCTPSP